MSAPPSPRRNAGRRRGAAPARERGATLVIALVFLVALLLLGPAIVATNAMQERMTGYDRDARLAFEAAEAALRDAEQYLLANTLAAGAFTDACAGGLCTTPAAWSPPRAESIATIYARGTVPGLSWSAAGAVLVYGAGGSPRLQPEGYHAAPPAYVIERLQALPTATGESLTTGVKPSVNGTAYRITAIGYGRRRQSSAVLQAIFVKR